jgi:beta-phosphoglucomutase
MGIEAVIFDFNGVLVDDESVHFALFREILEQQGVVITERDYHERYLGYDDRECFRAALTDAGQTVDRRRLDGLVARKAVRYVEVARHGLRYFPAAREAIESLSARWPIAICSGALRAEIELALQNLGQFERVAAIISAEDTEKCKPDPQGYLLALTALRVNVTAERSTGASRSKPHRHEFMPAECLVVEDSVAGIQSAKGAGMKAIGVPNTYSSDDLRRAGADEVIADLTSLTPEWIDRHFPSEYRTPNC